MNPRRRRVGFLLSASFACAAAAPADEARLPHEQRDTFYTAAPRAAASSARFLVRYDGGADEPLGLAVVRVLDAAWTEYADRLGCTPRRPVPVVLQTAALFRDDTRAPAWAAGWNDGTIRVPVMGITAPTPGLVRVLRHELAHSFVASGAGPRCPIWLHEGVAQWLEGGNPRREDAALAARARKTRLPRLEALESSFVGLPEAEATDAYAASLSAVAFIVAVRGEGGLRRLLRVLGAGQPPAQAMPSALSLSYAELQRGWERRLSRSRPEPAGAR